ncbi:MAG TPA: hypothetical protein VKV32_18045, partial [Stellaceae bacterium]|nr:hypothetical protein [Stellaceae bacterium]
MTSKAAADCSDLARAAAVASVVTTSRSEDLHLWRNFAIAIAALALSCVIFVAVPLFDYTAFESMLTTAVFVVTGIVGVMLWQIGARTGQSLPRMLAL